MRATCPVVSPWQPPYECNVAYPLHLRLLARRVKFIRADGRRVTTSRAQYGGRATEDRATELVR